jgi:hypothetical protein
MSEIPGPIDPLTKALAQTGKIEGLGEFYQTLTTVQEGVAIEVLNAQVTGTDEVIVIVRGADTPTYAGKKIGPDDYCRVGIATTSTAGSFPKRVLEIFTSGQVVLYPNLAARVGELSRDAAAYARAHGSPTTE